MKNLSKDICVIGGGIIGATVTRALSKKFPHLSIALIEKESSLGEHASTRNSSVIHSGLYYSTDSLKAKFCKAGNQALTEYCKDNKLPLKNTGKLVVATDEEEYERLIELKKQAELNGIEYEWLSFKEASSIERNLREEHSGYEYLFTPTTCVSDNVKVIECLGKELLGEKNVEILNNSAFLNRHHQSSDGSSNLIIHHKGSPGNASGEYEVNAKYVVNCAGLYADSIARLFGFCEKYTILPFKGHYLVAGYQMKTTHPVESLIYPIPPKKGNYFLGVHLTVTVDGHIKFGPSAMPAFYREQYGDSNQSFSDLGKKEILECADLLKEYLLNVCSNKSMFYLKHFLFETEKLYTPYVIKQAMKLCTLYDSQPTNMLGFPKDVQRNFKPGRTGIRAELVDLKTRELVNDFIIENDKHSIHLLNVVSPGWTCSMPIAEHVTEIIAKTADL